MSKKEQDLTVFGLGLGLFIPLVIMLRSIEHGLGFWGVVLAIVAALVILSKSVKYKIPYFLVLGVIVFKLVTGVSKHELGLISYVFLGIAIVFIAVTFINVRMLEPVYEKWMVAAHFIGTVITAVILTVFYYCVFGTAGLVLRLMKKDLLDRGLDKAASTYWNRRAEPADPKHYERQF